MQDEPLEGGRGVRGAALPRLAVVGHLRGVYA